MMLLSPSFCVTVYEALWIVRQSPEGPSRRQRTSLAVWKEY